MVRVSGRDYNGLLESPCYKGGQFSCLSCHSLHRSDPDQQLARNRSGDGACTQCHSEFTDESKRLAHTRHSANSSGSECYNCHMPRTTYGVLKAIRSHQVSSPRVGDQLATGRPNACNLCHLDKTLAWTAEHLTRWFGQPAPSLSAIETNVADGLRLALSGDAGQRALLAWHLGWEPARQASAGPSWIPPVLAQLLDDPYAAVRCIAARSLKATSEFVPPDYAFAQEPFRRNPVAGAVIERWLESTSKEARPGDLPIGNLESNPAAMQALFDQLRLQRDNEPVRLRE
jgi:predicted CXXCH cytochrome family protein